MKDPLVFTYLTALRKIKFHQLFILSGNRDSRARLRAFGYYARREEPDYVEGQGLRIRRVSNLGSEMVIALQMEEATRDAAQVCKARKERQKSARFMYKSTKIEEKEL